MPAALLKFSLLTKVYSPCPMQVDTGNLAVVRGYFDTQGGISPILTRMKNLCQNITSKERTYGWTLV